MPAARRRATPWPATSGLGSRIAITTRPTPAATSASQQGGVRPWCEQGSSVTKTVAPRTSTPRAAASRSAITSACGPPVSWVWPRPTTLPVAVDDDAADPRVGIGQADRLLGERERLAHGFGEGVRVGGVGRRVVQGVRRARSGLMLQRAEAGGEASHLRSRPGRPGRRARPGNSAPGASRRHRRGPADARCSHRSRPSRRCLRRSGRRGDRRCRCRSSSPRAAARCVLTTGRRHGGRPWRSPFEVQQARQPGTPAGVQERTRPMTLTT